MALTEKLIELAAERLTAPGLGKEVGPSLGINKSILQGIYLAPNVVASSLKTAILTSKMLEKLGYKVSPKYDEKTLHIPAPRHSGVRDGLFEGTARRTARTLART